MGGSKGQPSKQGGTCHKRGDKKLAKGLTDQATTC